MDHNHDAAFTVLLPPYDAVQLMQQQLWLGVLTPEWVLYTLFLHILPGRHSREQLLIYTGNSPLPPAAPIQRRRLFFIVCSFLLHLQDVRSPLLLKLNEKLICTWYCELLVLYNP